MLELLNIKPEPIIKDDLQWFKTLFKLCFNNQQESWSQHLDDQKYTAFHIKKQAFVFIYTVENYSDVLTIGVHPEHRKKGLATTLLEWVIAMAPDAQKFFLDVECQNIAALELYKKIGFEIIAMRKGYYPQSSGIALDALVMAYQKSSKALS